MIPPQFHRLSRLGKALVLVVLLAVVIYAGTKPRPVSPLPLPSPPPVLVIDGNSTVEAPVATNRLSAAQYRANFALVKIATNSHSPLLPPANAVTYQGWSRYGVAEDTFWLPACAAGVSNAAGRPATNWSFLLGTNLVEGLHVSSSGTLSFNLPKGSPSARLLPDGDPIDFLAPLQTHLSTVPPAGHFWHATTPSNTLLLTWQDVYFNRFTNYLITFQSELWPHGDFVYRYDLSQLPTFNTRLPTSNFVIGVQHNLGGETYTLGDINAVVDGLTLQWRAFGELDPEIDDHDGDGLSTWDELFVYGTDPSRADSDGDGLSDYEEIFTYGTDPLNHDTFGTGFPDGMSAAEWHSSPLFKAGEGKRLVTVDVDIELPQGSSAVLKFGGLPVILSAAGNWDFYLPTGTVHSVDLVTLGTPNVNLMLTTESGIVIDDPQGIITAAATQQHSPESTSAKQASGAGGITAPLKGGTFIIYSLGLAIASNPHIVHDEEDVTLHALMWPQSATLFADRLSWQIIDGNPYETASIKPNQGFQTTLHWPDSGDGDHIVVEARHLDTQMGVIAATATIYRCYKFGNPHQAQLAQC